MPEFSSTRTIVVDAPSSAARYAWSGNKKAGRLAAPKAAAEQT